MERKYGKRLKTNDYPKDSFDRFGDDLSEVIFGFMSFEDKVRFECVSKQWRRLVYNKQFVIEIYKNRKSIPYDLRNRLSDGNGFHIIDETMFEIMLKKCPNIKKVIIGKNIVGPELSAIGKHCPRLKALEVKNNCLAISHLLAFGVEYGFRLESFRVTSSYLYMGPTHVMNVTNFLQDCTNLKTFTADPYYYIYFIKEDPQYLIKLEFLKNLKININREWIVSNEKVTELKNLKILTDKYSQSLKKISIIFDQVTASQQKTCIGYICRFKSLQSLELQIFNEINSPLDTSFEQMTEKLSQLKSFSLIFSKGFLLSDRSMTALSKLKSLKKLKIITQIERSINWGIMLSHEWSQLRHLEIIYPLLDNDFVSNFHSSAPKLQTLKIQTKRAIKDSSIKSLQSMKYIESVVIEVIRIYRSEWFFGKHLNEMISKCNDNSIKRLNDKCGVKEIFH